MHEPWTVGEKVLQVAKMLDKNDSSVGFENLADFAEELDLRIAAAKFVGGEDEEDCVESLLSKLEHGGIASGLSFGLCEATGAPYRGLGHLRGAVYVEGRNFRVGEDP